MKLHVVDYSVKIQANKDAADLLRKAADEIDKNPNPIRYFVLTAMHAEGRAIRLDRAWPGADLYRLLGHLQAHMHSILNKSERI